MNNEAEDFDPLDRTRRERLQDAGKMLLAIAGEAKAVIAAKQEIKAETAGTTEDGRGIKLTGRCRMVVEAEWDERDPDARRADEASTVTIRHLGRVTEFRLGELGVEIKPAFGLRESAGGPIALCLNGILLERTP